MNTILRNFLTTIKRFKLASLLNVVGLSVAFAAFIVIMIQVNYEYGFDKNYEDSDRIYRLNTIDGDEESVVVSKFLFENLSEISTGVDQMTLIESSWNIKQYFTVENDNQKEGYKEFIGKAWSNLPSFWGMKLVKGDFKKFEEPNTAIIPKSLSDKIFKDKNPIGKQILVDNNTKYACTIVAVFEDLPENGQLENIIYKHFPKEYANTWYMSNFLSYVKLTPNATQKQVLSDFKKFDVLAATGWIKGVTLTPLEDIHFEQKVYFFDDVLVKKGDKQTTDILFAIGILIMIMAAINFVNFSTSLAPMRMKSINVQKVFGVKRYTLCWAMICEAIGICLISFGVAIFWVDFISYTGWQNIVSAGVKVGGNGDVIVLVFILAIIIGLVSGIYPSLYATQFSPALVLKGSFGLSKKGRMLRTTLVGFQYIVSIGLIIGAIFLQLQNNFMRNVKKGYDSEQVVVMNVGGELAKQPIALISQMKSNANVEDVAFCQYKIGATNLAQGFAKNLDEDPEQESFSAIMASWNFPQMMGMELTDGEWLTESTIQNQDINQYFIFNETAQKQYGVKVGQKLDQNENVYSVVPAIIKDINYKSLHSVTGPLAFVVNNSKYGIINNYMYVKTKSDPVAALKHIENVAKNLDPTYPVEIEFLDAGFEAMYRQDIQTSKLITFFTILAILISLVGVFGLVVFETQYKRKEIGVRKIMGSTVRQILIMINRKFVYIALVCFVIAVPLVYLAVDAWLGGFAYRTPMSWWVFVLGGVVVLTVTVAVVTIQSYRSATENPVNALKKE